MKNVRIWVILLILLFCEAAYAKTYKHEVAICAIFQNEAPYLKEWIEFHKLVGVKHFYLYNNLSTDAYKKVLGPYIKSKEVELINWEYESNNLIEWDFIQTLAYMNAIERSKGKVKWLAILDIDEFLFPVEVDTLTEFLKDYEEFAGVCANWQMYGTSDLEKILPDHLLIEDLIYKAPTDFNENRNVKSIIRPTLVHKNNNPHYCILLPNQFQVNSDKEPFVAPFSPVVVNKLRINHYWTRDQDFFYNVKLGRRSKWDDEICIQRANLINQEVDTAIYKYVPRLKEALGL